MSTDSIQRLDDQDNDNKEINVEDISNFKETAETFFVKAWSSHKWLTEQPEYGEGKNNKVSSLIHVLCFIIACIPAYDIYIYHNTYTSVETKFPGVASILAPDAVICPKRNACPSCKPPFSNYKFEHMVWWNYEMLKLLNISNAHLNMLADFVQKKAFGEHIETPAELEEYLARAKAAIIDGFNVTYPEYHSMYAEHRDPKHHLNMEKTGNVTLNHVWHVLVKVPSGTNYAHSNGHLGWLSSTFLEPRFTWLNKSFCLLYENTDIKINSTRDYTVLQIPSGSNYFIGNITSDLLQSHKMNTLPDTCNSERNYYTITNAKHLVETVIVKDNTISTLKRACQKDLSIHSAECKDEYLDEYTLHLVHLTSAAYETLASEFSGNVQMHGKMRENHVCSPYQHITFGFELPNWHISKNNVYSWLSRTEITMGIICFFIGFSFYQVLSIMASLLGKKWDLFNSIFIKVVFLVILAILTILLLINDLNDLFAPSFVHKVTLGTHLPMLSYRLSSYYGSFLNFTKIEGLNISLSLLHYISIASTMTAMGKYDMGISSRKNFLALEFLKTRNKTKICANEIKVLHAEYKSLARKMGVKTNAPAFDLLQQLYIDKCQIILGCSFSGKSLANCCKYAYFALHFVEKIRFEGLQPFLVMDNYERVFQVADNRGPDIRIHLNITTMSQAPAFSRFVHKTFFHQVSKASIKSAINEKKLSWLTFQIGTVQNNFTWIKQGVRHSFTDFTINEHRRYLILLRDGTVSELRKQTGPCVETTACLLTKYPLTTSNNIGQSAKNVFVEKYCGCLVCYKGMNPIMAANGKCCSPEQAVDCILNPLLNVPRVDRTKCQKSAVQCRFDRPDAVGKKACSATQENTFLDLPMFTDLMKKNDEKIKKYFPEDMITETFNKNHTVLDEIRKLLKSVGCGHLADGNPKLCNSVKPLQSFISVQASKKFKTKSDVTPIEIHMAKESILNNFETSRADRKFTILEALGICLGGVGLFLGLDILCLFEAGLNIANSKKSDLVEKLEEAFLPIHLHLMGMFYRISLDKKKSQEHAAKIKQAKQIANQQKQQENDIQQEDNVESEENKETGVIKFGMFFLTASLLFVSGIGLSAYVGSSSLLRATEYNLDVIQEIIPQQTPSIAFCLDTYLLGEKSLPMPWNDTRLSFLSNKLTKCWLDMVERPCKSMLKFYVFDGQKHCWFTSQIPQFGERQPDEHFYFIMAAPRSIARKLSIWFGNIQTAISGSILSESWERRYDSRSYQELRNLSCKMEAISDTICPPCYSVGSHANCCISCMNGCEDPTAFISEGACTRIFKRIVQSRDFLAATLISSDIITQNAAFFNRGWDDWFFGLKRTTPHILVFKEMARHSLGAKFSIVTGYVDLFLGLSVLAISGAAVAKLSGLLKKKIETFRGNATVEPRTNMYKEHESNDSAD